MNELHFSQVDALRFTVDGAEPELINPCPVEFGLVPHVGEDPLRLERCDLSLAVCVAPETSGFHDGLRQALEPVTAVLRRIPAGARFQVEAWTAVYGAEIVWCRTTLRAVEQLDTDALDVELVEPDNFEPYARVTFARAVVRPDADGRFWRMQTGAEAPPPLPADAPAPTPTGTP